MNMIKAMEQTLQLAMDRGFAEISYEEGHVDYAHLSSMLERMTDNEIKFSEAKLGRWLGYAQGVLVAHAILTLDECKEINLQHSNDWTHRHLKRGSKYKVVGEVRVQCSTNPIKDGDMLVLYIGEDDVYSARAPDEFEDGRFEKL